MLFCTTDTLWIILLSKLFLSNAFNKSKYIISLCLELYISNSHKIVKYFSMPVLLSGKMYKLVMNGLWTLIHLIPHSPYVYMSFPSLQALSFSGAHAFLGFCHEITNVPHTTICIPYILDIMVCLPCHNQVFYTESYK